MNLSIGNTTFNNVWFINSSTGWIIAPGGSIQISTNGGNSWSAQSSSTTSNLMAIWFTPSGQRGWVGGSGGVIRFTSENLGTNWTSQISNTSSQIEEFFFLNSTTGWAAGSGGAIIKTYTGGLLTGISKKENLPSAYSLYQNHPNPFNPKTIIKFDIPEDTYAKLTVFDILGNEVEVLVNPATAGLKPGTYEIEWNAGDYPSGIYFYKLEAPGFTETKKMILIK
jgi:hypothetical protein